MFRRAFILSFFLGFTQVSLAGGHHFSTCDEGEIWIDEYAWAHYVRSQINICKTRNTYFCVAIVAPCKGKAEEILAKIEKEAEAEETQARVAVNKFHKKSDEEKKAEAAADKILKDEVEEQLRRENSDLTNLFKE